MSTPNPKPVARGNTPPAAPEADAVTAESLGWQLRGALPPMRLHSVSLYNNDADCLWLSEGALGPDEHNVVVEAIEYLKEEKGTLYHELGMEDGRIAIFLGIRGPRLELVGTVLVLADMKSMSEGTMDRILTVPMKTLMHKTAVFMRKTFPQVADAGTAAAVPAAAPAPAPVATAASAPAAVSAAAANAKNGAAGPAVLKAAPVAPSKNAPATGATLGPKEVDTILTLELVDEPAATTVNAAPAPVGKKGAADAKAVSPSTARAPVVKSVPTPPVPAAKNAAAGKNAAGSTAGGNAGVAGKRGNASGSAPVAGNADSLPTLGPLPDIEVLAFDADLTINSARPVFPQSVPTALPPEDVLPFDPSSLEIPTAHPAPTAAAAPAVEIEVLDFDAELTMAPNAKLTKAAQAAIAEPVVAKAANMAAPATAKAAAAKIPPVVSPVTKAAPAAAPIGMVATPAVATAAEVPEASYDALAAFEAGITDAASSAHSTPAGYPAEVAVLAASEVTAPASASFQPSTKTPAPTPATDAKVSAAAATASAELSPKSATSSGSTTTAKAIGATSRLKISAKPAPPATVSVPVLNQNPTGSTTTAKKVDPARDEEPLLISDTAPVKKLVIEEEPPVEALVVTPPPPPLSVAETATDLMLFVQELIKLRSSGRTRRYEVLARSIRDAGRNEVPTAFTTEGTRGKDGAALDGLVLERLLQWLSQNGETIWDSEPASFSVNLSIGAIEDVTFTQKIGQWLEQYNVPAEYVGFEISEFACIQCRPAVERFVAEIEKLGCFLVIDNFSFDSNMFELLGSKSLRHVKIDPKLTSVAMKEKLPQALVVAILQACKVLGVHCVAKRIDGQGSLQWLTAVGCDFAQSFQLEKPAPIDRLVTGKSIKALRE